MRNSLVVLPWTVLAATAGAQSFDPAAPPPSDADLAQQSPAQRDPFALSIYWENDGGPVKRNELRDQHYTNGLAIVLAHRPAWADRLADFVPFASEGMDRTAGGYYLQQLMFTPEEILESGIIEDDRPYAGYLAAGAFWQRASDAELDHLQLEVGITGDSSLAEEIQTSVHEWVDTEAAEGWHNQIDDQPQIQFYARRKWRIGLDPIDIGETRIDAQVIPTVGFALGTVYRHLEAGGTFRIGFNLPDDFGPGRVADLGSRVGDPAQGWSFYGFARAGGRLVEHNTFLEGNDFEDDPHTVEAEPLVGEISAGLVVGYRRDRWAAELSYSQTALTEEFKTQTGSDSYGMLGLSLMGWF